MKNYIVDFEYYINKANGPEFKVPGSKADSLLSKIDCIKAIRNGLGIGLKEAKDIVELAINRAEVNPPISTGSVSMRTTAEAYGRLCASLAVGANCKYCGEVRIYRVQEIPPVDHDLTAL